MTRRSSPGARQPPDFLQAIAHHQAGRSAEAAAGYGAVLRKQPGHVPSLHMLGVLHHEAGRWDQAVPLLERAIALNPGDPALRRDLGLILSKAGQFEAALACHQAVMALTPTAPEAFFNLASALAALGRMMEAVTAFRQALELRPAYAEAHNNLGEALIRLGDLEGATQHLRQAARLRPDLPEPLNNLGNLLLDQGDLTGAMTLYRQALRFRPDQPQSQRNLAICLARVGKIDEALMLFDRILAQSPQDRGVSIARATLLAESGRADQALPIILSDLDAGVTSAGKAAFVRCLARLELVSDSEPLRRWLAIALAEPWCAPRQISRAILQLLRQTEDLTKDPLLIALMTVSVIGDSEIEQALTRLRAEILFDPDQPRHLDFQAALAQLCFNNDYVFDQTEAEAIQVANLKAALNTALGTGTAIPAGWIAAIASYQSLDQLDCAEMLLARDWPDSIRAVLRQQIEEPATQRQMADALAALTAVNDPVSSLVRAQYEKNPYPRWVKLAPAELPIRLDVMLQRRFPGGPYQPRPAEPVLDVLIAGCGTGQHPIQTARRYEGAQVTAVDLSRASLGYAARKAHEMGVANITFAQADLLELGNWEQRFDLIESVGVLHHLADPMAGWRVLVGLLQPGGVMRIGLYSALARSGVVACRALIEDEGLQATDADIRACRHRIMRAPIDDPMRGVMRLDDFFSLSECRDLLFHVQEHRFTFPQIRQALTDLDLEFLGFDVETGVEAAFRRLNPAQGDLYDLTKWHLFEQAHPDSFIGMYHFFVQRR